jgi:hypothetical protein
MPSRGRALAEQGGCYNASDYILNLHALYRRSRRIPGFFSIHDIWLMPTLATM